MRKIPVELCVIVLILIFSFFLFGKIDLLESIVEFSAEYEEYEVDEIVSTTMVLAVCLLIFSFRRWRETTKLLKAMEVQNKELRIAKETIKRIEGIIPICMHCKQIRDDNGAWHQLEKYIGENSDAEFSHGICDKCMEKHLG